MTERRIGESIPALPPPEVATAWFDDGAVHSVAARLRHAERLARATPSPRTTLGDISLADAYAIQEEYVRSRTAEGGGARGYKVGAAPGPIYGVLFDDGILPNGSVLASATLIQPAVEVEIGFVLGAPLRGPGLDAADVLSATEYIVACFEIVDSRIEGGGGTIVDTVADNGRAARVVLGALKVPPRQLEVALATASLERNDQIVASAAGTAGFGDPASSVAWIANELGRKDHKMLIPGQIILSGAIIPAVPARHGDVFRASISELGEVQCSFA